MRKGFFTFEQFTALRLELPEHLRPVITFAYYTVCRKGEILALQWSQVDTAARLVRLEPGDTKNDDARAIPHMSELYEMLVMQRQIRDQKWPTCLWIFFRFGKPHGAVGEPWRRGKSYFLSNPPSRIAGWKGFCR